MCLIFLLRLVITVKWEIAKTRALQVQGNYNSVPPEGGVGPRFRLDKQNTSGHKYKEYSLSRVNFCRTLILNIFLDFAV